MKLLSPLLTSFFIFLLLFTLIFGFMSYPIDAELVTGSNKRIDWDDFLIGASSGAGSFYNWARSGGDDFNIVIDHINTSNKELYQQWNSYTFLYDAVDSGNIYITNDDMVTNTTKVILYHNFKGYDSGGTVESGAKIWNFYRNGTIVMKIAWKSNHYTGLTGATVGHNGYCIYNYTTSQWDNWFMGGASNYGDIDSYLDITVGNQDWIFDTCSILLKQYSNDAILAQDTGLETGDGLPFDFFDRIQITYGFTNGPSANVVRIWEQIDDIVFFSETFIPPEYDVSIWQQIGDLENTGIYHTSPIDEFLETERHVKMTVEIKAVDLFIHSKQLTHISSNLQEYWLSINGQAPINPIAFIPYGSKYLIRWYYTNISIVDEYPLFEFFCSASITEPHPFYWDVSICDEDTDNDNDIQFKYADDSEYWADGEYNAPKIRQGKDLNYAFYVPYGDTYIPPEIYNDSIDTDKNTYNQFDDVFISYTVSSVLHVNKLVIKKDATEVYNNSFSGYSGFYVFTPISSGEYTAEIYRNGVTEAICSFIVNAIDSDYWLYVIPNPSEPTNSFTVYFNYNYSLHDCAILMYRCFNPDTPYKRWIFTDVPINSSFQYSIDTEGVYYFDLAYRFFDNNTQEYIYTSLLRKTHTVKSSYTNVIYAQFDSIEGDECNVLWGSHNYLGRNVKIRVNGETLDTSDNDCGVLPSEFSQTWCPVYSGDYVAELILIQSDEIFILSSCTFSVTGDYFEPDYDPDAPTGDPVMDAFIGIPEWAKVLIGALITLGFTFIPLYMLTGAKKLQVTEFKIPPVIYAVCGSVGAVMSVSFGFWGFEYLFFISVIAGFSLLISYMWKERSD